MRELLRQQRLLWFGHCIRMGDERLPKMAVFGRLEGKRPRGRPPRRWREDVLRGDMAAAKLDQAWPRLAADRAAWKGAVTKALKALSKG